MRNIQHLIQSEVYLFTFKPIHDQLCRNTSGATRAEVEKFAVSGQDLYWDLKAILKKSSYNLL